MTELSYYNPIIHTTPIRKTSFLTEPGYVLMGMTVMLDGAMTGLAGFLNGFEEKLGFRDYVLDPQGDQSSGELLCKIAGQLCYMSFGEQRTYNKDAIKYFRNILESGHGSVLEHLNFTWLFYGMNRSLTHELVRHRAGFGYSQVSQRYVDGSKLRFVMRPEFRGDHILEERFFDHIDDASYKYEELAGYLLEKQNIALKDATNRPSKTDLRKGVNQVARSVLPNDTEAPIMVTGNARAIRHMLSMRGSPYSEPEIRNLAIPVAAIMRREARNVFQDVEYTDLGVTLVHPKV